MLFREAFEYFKKRRIFMKRRSHISVLCCLLMLALLLCTTEKIVLAQDQQTIAIFYFGNNSVVDKDKLDPLKKGLTDMLITELSKIRSLKVIERPRIRSVVEELNLGEPDFIDKNTSQQIGKLLGAKVLLFGRFSNVFGDKLRIDARIVTAETGFTLQTEEETGSADHVLTMVKSFAKEICQGLDIRLSKTEEDQLEAAKDGPLSGYLSFGLGLDLEDKAIAFEQQGRHTDALATYENARAMYQKASEQSGGYEPAKQKADEMTLVIAKMKKEWR